jgi:hypothetical protein
MPAEFLFPRQQIVQVTHQRPDTIDSIDARQVARQFPVIGRRIVAQFQHVAENGNAAALLQWPRLEAVERGCH